MKAIISRTTNGAWVRLLADRADDEHLSAKEDLSYQFDAYKKFGDDMSGAVEMMYDILTFMGWVGNKTDKERIEVRVVHGSSFEHETEAEMSVCKICERNGGPCQAGEQ